MAGDEGFRAAIANSAPLSVVLAAAYDAKKSRQQTNAEAHTPTGWHYSFLLPVVMPDQAFPNVIAASAVGPGSWHSLPPASFPPCAGSPWPPEPWES
jgi:hypothetical protein